MEEFSPELKIFLELLEKKEKMVAMLAPSFPIDFSYPQIIGKLKRLGCQHVVEVTRGAMETNRQVLKELKENPQNRYITAPCPAIVRLIRNKYPQLKKFLSLAHSPMVNIAKIVLKEFPGARPIFIGPCLPKKFEAREDYPELKIVALTFKELKKALAIKKIGDDPTDASADFDIGSRDTRLYAISGGLAQSCGLNQKFTDAEQDVISGLKLVDESLQGFEENKLMRVLDILYCDGGCIGGQGIDSQLPLEERRKKIISYWV